MFFLIRSFPCLWDSLTENKFRMTCFFIWDPEINSGWLHTVIPDLIRNLFFNTTWDPESSSGWLLSTWDPDIHQDDLLLYLRSFPRLWDSLTEYSSGWLLLTTRDPDLRQDDFFLGHVELVSTSLLLSFRTWPYVLA